MARVIPGNSINTSNLDPAANHVRQNAKYIDGRRIDHLATVGGFSGQDKSVANRVDGIIDNQPANHKDEIDELLRMGEPHYFGTISDGVGTPLPNERPSFAKVWKLLELDPVPAPVAPQLPNLTPLAQLVDLQTSVPSALDMTKEIDITRLSQPIQDTAYRIELVLNTDSVRTTISLADVRQALADPGRFLPEETDSRRGEAKKIEQELLKIIRSEPGAMKATMIVPEPGRTLTAVTNLVTRGGQTVPGSVAFNHVSDIRIEDQVHLHHSRNNGRYGGTRTNVSAVPTLQVVREQFYEAKVPAGHQLIVMSLDGETEALYQAGTHRLGLKPGKQRVELWKDGQRMEQSEVLLPQVPSSEIQKIRYAAGVPMKTANGTELVRRIDKSTPNGSTHVHVGRYEPASMVNRRTDLASYNQFTVGLPAGVYEIPNRNETLRVYSNKLVSIANGATEEFLYPAYDNRAGINTGTAQRASYKYLATGSNAAVSIQFGTSGRTSVQLKDRIA